MSLHADREAYVAPGDVLDPKIVAQYRAGLFMKIAQLYLDVAPRMVQGAQLALGQGDAAAIRQICHTLKSSSANVGAMEFSDICRQLEAAARDEDLAMASGLLPKFVGCHEATVEALQSRLEELPTE